MDIYFLNSYMKNDKMKIVQQHQTEEEKDSDW